MRIANRKPRAETDAKPGQWSTLDYATLTEMAENLNIRVRERPFGNRKINGVYSDAERMIIINQGKLEHQKRCAMAHEIVHALRHDPGCSSLFGSEAEKHTRLDTAVSLLDPREYSVAEAMYETDTFSIACELEVTVQVVEDYQRWLDSHLIRADLSDVPVFA